MSAETDNYARAKEMLARFGGCFDERTRELLDELVENNELGVAFEMVAGTLAQGDEPISEEDLAYASWAGRGSPRGIRFPGRSSRRGLRSSS